MSNWNLNRFAPSLIRRSPASAYARDGSTDRGSTRAGAGLVWERVAITGMTPFHISEFSLRESVGMRLANEQVAAARGKKANRPSCCGGGGRDNHVSGASCWRSRRVFFPARFYFPSLVQFTSDTTINFFFFFFSFSERVSTRMAGSNGGRGEKRRAL